MRTKVHNYYGGEEPEYAVAGKYCHGSQGGEGHYATASDYSGHSGRSYHAAMLHTKRDLYHIGESCIRGDCNERGTSYVTS